MYRCRFDQRTVRCGTIGAGNLDRWPYMPATGATSITSKTNGHRYPPDHRRKSSRANWAGRTIRRQVVRCSGSIPYSVNGVGATHIAARSENLSRSDGRCFTGHCNRLLGGVEFT